MVPVKKKVQSQAMKTGIRYQYRLIIPIVSLLLLGAHAFRRGDDGLAVSFAILIALLFSRQAWVRMTVAAAFLWGGYVWVDSMVEIISFRQTLGLPWMRLAVIMGGVIMFDGLALAVMLGRRMEQHFIKNVDRGLACASIFVLTAFGLAMARYNVTFPVLLAGSLSAGMGGGSRYSVWRCMHSGSAASCCVRRDMRSTVPVSGACFPQYSFCNWGWGCSVWIGCS